MGIAPTYGVRFGQGSSSGKFDGFSSNSQCDWYLARRNCADCLRCHLASIARTLPAIIGVRSRLEAMREGLAKPREIFQKTRFWDMGRLTTIDQAVASEISSTSAIVVTRSEYERCLRSTQASSVARAWDPSRDRSIRRCHRTQLQQDIHCRLKCRTRQQPGQLGKNRCQP